MNKIDLTNLIERHVGDKTLIVDIKKNAIYEVDEATALYIDLIKSNNGIVDYILLKKHSSKDMETLKKEITELLEILSGDSNE